MRWLVFAALSLMSFPGLAFDSRELEQILERAQAEMNMPGARAAVALPAGQLVQSAVGLADIENRRPMSEAPPMPGGSTGKPFVAALTMLLVEDGILSLDDPVAHWLGERPWFRRVSNAQTMQLRHLLSHSAGVGDYVGQPGFFSRMVWRVLRHGSAYFAPEELVNIAGRRKPLFLPGQGFAYSDAGYLILGRAIEAASGKTYHELLTDRILRPHRLDDVQPVTEAVLPTPGYQGGVRTTREDGRPKFDPRSEWTGGGLHTTPEMLVAFFRALSAGEIVSAAGVDAMINGGWRNPESPDSWYGFGLFIDRDGEVISHGGLWAGFRTHVLHDRRSNVTVSVQTNRDGRIDLATLAQEIHDVAAAGL